MAEAPSFVLIGEASHGTEEVYQTRAELSRRFVDRLGFNAVVIEGDWPKATRVNRYVLADPEDSSAEEALSDFDVFPEWMWRNTAVRNFVEWLREHNAARPSGTIATEFYGMDLYSPIESASAVIEFLSNVDSAEAARAAACYAPLLHLDDPQEYGAAVTYGRMNSLASAVREQFQAVQRIAERSTDDSQAVGAAAAFEAAQNARPVMNAEECYRGMYTWSTNSSNIRDRHMADSLDAIAAFLRARDGYARILVGLTTPTSGMRERQTQRCAANGTSGSLCAKGIRVRSLWSASAPATGQSTPPMTGVHLEW